MKINPINLNSPAFGYSHELKTLYKKGLIKIDYDFYGDKLTKDSATLEHLKPHSKGGKTTLSNLVLATRKSNQMRGNRPLREYYNPAAAENYFNYFKGLFVRGFNGDKYIKLIKRTISNLLKER